MASKKAKAPRPLKLRQITIDEITWSVRPEPDHVPVRGNFASGDDRADRAMEDQIIADLESGNPWAWAFVVVTGQWKGIEVSEGLGACSYASEEDFRAPGGYFQDFQRSITEEINSRAQEIAQALGRA